MHEYPMYSFDLASATFSVSGATLISKRLRK